MSHKYIEDGKVKLAEAIFYFLLEAAEDPGDRNAFAMVVPWSPPDQELWEMSSHTLWSCPPLDYENIAVIPVKWIRSVISMGPHRVHIIKDVALRERLRGRWHIVHNLGAVVCSLADRPIVAYDEAEE